ncbi:MAG: undecaprenyl-diphosphate phosphatase, partial [Frankiales bacterium]
MRARRGAALGAVQGAAEVVPVSSSAQLVLVPWLLGWEQPADRTAFAAGLHAGSCAGLAWALRDELRRLTPREVLVLGAVS